jgi:epoxyqueuosine reductase
MLAEVYTPTTDPLEIIGKPDRAAISAYAQGKDYHDLVKRRLKRLGTWLVAETGAEIKVFVDTAPVMEKPLAQAAGLGWQGKHTNLLSRDLGSWFCLDICPTGAFPAPYQLDARRCISYLTIEHHGPVDQTLRALMGNRIYGCDDCLAVCPWNKFAAAARDIGYQPRVGAPELAELAALDDPGFRARFAGSPIKRIGRNRFVRNVLYAIGNSDLKDLRPVAALLLNDPDPAVADAAGWAMERLSK